MAANPAMQDPAVPAFDEVSLRALKLRPGMFLQSQRMEKNSPTYESQFLGLIDGKCLMVVPVGTFSIKTGMKAGDTFVIRGFTGQYDFHFVSKVIQAFDFTFREPCYAYAVLSWPEQVQARKVRNSLRIRTQIAATATPRNGQPACEATLLDLSIDGALLRCPVDLGWVGEVAEVSFNLGEGPDAARIETLARICHRREDEGQMLFGLLFDEIDERERVDLREFVLDAVE